MARPFRVSVIGAGICDENVARKAYELGKLIACEGWEIVCGGKLGVMQAAAKGCTEAGGSTIGILPGLDPDEANPYIQTAIATGLGQMRNMLVVANGDVVIAVYGGYGTLSEVALALKHNKTVIALGDWKEIPGVVSAQSPSEAVGLAKDHFTR